MARTVIITRPADLTAERATLAPQRRRRPATCLLRAELAAAIPALAEPFTVRLAVRITAIRVSQDTTAIRAARC